MTINLLVMVQILCFQLCSIPAIIRIVRRRSSGDLSVWREVLIMIGVSCQFTVMQLAGAPWQIWISPIMSALNVIALLTAIWWFRVPTKKAPEGAMFVDANN